MNIAFNNIRQPCDCVHAQFCDPFCRMWICLSINDQEFIMYNLSWNIEEKQLKYCTDSTCSLWYPYSLHSPCSPCHRGKARRQDELEAPGNGLFNRLYCNFIFFIFFWRRKRMQLNELATGESLRNRYKIRTFRAFSSSFDSKPNLWINEFVK